MSDPQDDAQEEALLDWDDPEDDEDAQEEDGSDLDDVIADSQGPRVVTELPGGVGALVLTGRGAGRTVVPPSSATGNTTQSASGLPTRDEALSGSRPLMIVHCPHRDRRDIPHLLASILTATSGNVGLGAAVRLPTATATAHTNWLDDCAAAVLRIADPACYLLDPSIVRVKAVSTRSKKWWPYLASPSPSVDEVLDAQRAVGANLLLSPGRAVDPSGGQKALDDAFDEATRALELLAGGERLALNLTLPGQWLSSPTARNMLLDQLLDQDQFRVWHIRVQWPAALSPYQQPVDLNLLRGYKRLAQIAEDEERILLLPQTGLTGWLQLGFGATGFGAGPWSSSHAFKEEKEQGGGGGNPEVQRYFEPTLLHTIERSVHDVLSSDPEYVTCNCPFCPVLLSGGVWNHRLAKQHQLHWLGRLSGDAALNGRTLASQVRHTVQAALSERSRSLLSGLNVPAHLQAWDQIL
ncbi:hypothetical protein OG203_10760 [Nocardia sp. NBC_01499]|uniref:hypothetical protein n=1 Tax=Nocardia sp. NBC_01499 TaxID=2903597 RepID=UPI00386A6B13